MVNEVMRTCSIMVGVSTRQNTANLIPFHQFSGDKLILLETDHAKEKKWSAGVAAIIRKMGKECQVINIGSGMNLAEIDKALERHLEGIEKAVCWNFGGGQKLQQLVLFNHFTSRIKQWGKDWACYAEPQTRKIVIITTANGQRLSLASEKIATDCRLDLQDILLIFNCKSPKSKCLWERTGPKSGDLFEENLLNKDEDQWFDNYEKRQQIFHFELEVEKEKKDPDPEKVFPPKFYQRLRKKRIGKEKIYAEYFERLVQTRVTRVIAAKPEHHLINQVWANVHIFPCDGKNEKAEYDLVLVTNFGTIIPIDAKSYDFPKKDEDARRHNLNELSGVYTDFWVIFPFYPEDLPANSILNEKDWQPLLNSPFNLRERKTKFLGLADPGNRPIFIRKEGKHIKLVRQKEKADKDCPEIKYLENLLETLKIDKQ